MTVASLYLSTADFKARTRSATAANDAAIAAVLASASREIDRWTGRWFGQDGSEMTAAVRYASLPGCQSDVRPFPTWQPWSGDTRLDIPDTVSLTEVATDQDGDGIYETVWDAAEYLLRPGNAAALGEPYTQLRTTQAATHTFPTGPDAIRLTGVFGWPAVPDTIVEVCFLIANRLKSLWDAPFGLSGGGEMGALDMTNSLTPILKGMLSPYRLAVL